MENQIQLKDCGLTSWTEKKWTMPCVLVPQERIEDSTMTTVSCQDMLTPWFLPRRSPIKMASRSELSRWETPGKKESGKEDSQTIPTIGPTSSKKSAKLWMKTMGFSGCFSRIACRWWTQSTFASMTTMLNTLSWRSQRTHKDSPWSSSLFQEIAIRSQPLLFLREAAELSRPKVTTTTTRTAIVEESRSASLKLLILNKDSLNLT